YEAPRPGSHRMFAEVRRDALRDDRCNRHGEQLRERRERLLECDDDRAVVRRRESRDRARLLRVKIARSLDRVKEFAGRALTGRVEGALPAMDDVARPERGTVVEE